MIRLTIGHSYVYLLRGSGRPFRAAHRFDLGDPIVRVGLLISRT